MNVNLEDSLFKSDEFKNWKKKWNKRTENDQNYSSIMKMNNPIYIPRNHLVESALKNAINGNKKEFDKLLFDMSNTYNYKENHNNFQTIPNNFDETYKTFCGT